MTRVFENQVFERYYEDGCGASYSDIIFTRCTFRSCNISITRDPRLRTTVRNVRLIDCTYKRNPAGLFCPIIEEALVENLRIEELLQTWGAVFKHTVLKGRIDRIMISTCAAPVAGETESRAFAKANASYYASIDWALDISQAEFQECDIRNVSARLIRRDPSTQVVVTREKALEGAWKELPLERTYWPIAIEDMLKLGWPDVVLVAPKRSRDFKILLAGLELLRRAGVAEPD